MGWSIKSNFRMTKDSIRMKYQIFSLIFLALLVGVIGCSDSGNTNEINIGFIGPLSERATDLGVGPSKAMQLAIDQYNQSREKGEPKINLFIEDDQWEKERALPAYDKLRHDHKIDVLFVSNTGGTVAVQDNVLKDGVILINPLNNDEMLASMNKNTFEIAKSTEEANGVVGVRIIELGLKKVVIYHFPNDFMTRAAFSIKELLDERGIENTVEVVDKDQVDFTESLARFKEIGVEGYVFCGYKNFGFAMKQARDMGIEAPFFGSTTLLDPEFFDNSEGTIVNTECTFFTPADGNYVLAHQFLEDYELKYGEKPFSIWPPMQAYDAMNIVLDKLRHVNEKKPQQVKLEDWLRAELHSVRYYQGVCGNLSITEDGSSRGIYFSLYNVAGRGELVKVKR